MIACHLLKDQLTVCVWRLQTQLFRTLEFTSPRSGQPTLQSGIYRAVDRLDVSVRSIFRLPAVSKWKAVCYEDCVKLLFVQIVLCTGC